jgi:hypothetical protein
MMFGTGASHRRMGLMSEQAVGQGVSGVQQDGRRWWRPALLIRSWWVPPLVQGHPPGTDAR